MRIVRQFAAVVVAAARVGFADLAAIYTWRGWFFGWFLRLTTQVIFFSLFGLLLGSESLVYYRAIGNSASLVCIEAMAVVLAVTRERGEGTLILQLLTPSSFTITYLARGVCNLIVGIGSSTGAFIIAIILFRIPFAFPQVLLAPVMFAIMALASYCYGLALGAVVMAHRNLQWLVINLGYLSVMTFGGVNVPVSYWPPALRTIATALPLTHGLAAFRLLLANGAAGQIAADVGGELIVALCWMALAVTVLSLAVHRGLRRGTLELASV